MKTLIGKLGSGFLALIGLTADLIALFAYFRATSTARPDANIPLRLSIPDMSRLFGLHFMPSRLLEFFFGLFGVTILVGLGLYAFAAIRIVRRSPRAGITLTLLPILVISPLLLMWAHLSWGWLPIRSTFIVIETSLIWLAVVMVVMLKVSRRMDLMGCVVVILLGSIIVPFLVAYVFAGWSFLQSAVVTVLVCLFSWFIVERF